MGRSIRILAALVFCGLLMPGPADAGETPSKPLPETVAADLILYNGKIVTVDKAFDIEQAIAIRGPRIIDVGSDRSILALAGEKTRIVDLGGRTVIPGLIDDHTHLLHLAVDYYLGTDVVLVKSISEMVERIQEKIRKTPPGALVYTTSGWRAEQLAEKRPPDRHDLDPVSPDNPVLVKYGHAYILNSYALNSLGITRDTPDPEGGIVEKDAKTGEPTGRLFENAMKLAHKKWIPGTATHDEKIKALRAAVKKLNAVGVTGIREPGLDPEDMRVYQDLQRAGDLTIRVSMNLNLPLHESAEALIGRIEPWGVGTGFGDHMLRLDGIGEFGIDGGFESALMSKPYEKFGEHDAPPDYVGLQRIPTEKFERVLNTANRLNWRGSVHVVGDRGIDLLLAAYARANKEKSIIGKRWVIEHAHYMRPDQFQKVKDLGLVISTQFHNYMAGQAMDYLWGKERGGNAMRIRDWLDAGIIVGGGSDWTLLPANPFWVMYSWITRDTRLGGVIGPQQRISRAEALRVMTINNAYITFEEDVKGSLERGKLADLLVLSDDFLTVPEAQLRDITPVATIFNGQVVYGTLTDGSKVLQ